MDWNRLKEVEYLYQIGGIVVLSSLLTLVITEIIKRIIKKRWIDKSEKKKDEILQTTGRCIALVVYTSLTVISELVVNHQIMIDGALLVSLLAGSTMTLNVAKGVYTWIHQKRKTEVDQLDFSKTDANTKKVIVLGKKQTKEQNNGKN